MSPKHSNTTPGWILQRFLKNEKQAAMDRAAKKLQAATIGRGGLTIRDGGGVTIKDGGSVVVEHGGGFLARWANGRASTYFGPHVDGSHGVSVFRDTTADPDGASTVFAAVTLQGQPGRVFVGQDADPVTLFAVRTAVASMSDGAGNTYVYLDASFGLWLGHPQGVKIDHSTTAAAANCYIDPSDNRIWRSTSSRKNKLDIEDTTVDVADVLALRGVTFRDKGQVESDPDTTARFAGFIAEELHELPTMRQFVVYDAEGEPEAIAYDRLTVALLAVLKDQDKRITALEAETAEP